MASTMATRWGFPGPGFQEPRPEEIISDSIFMSSQNWHELENFNDYDYVVVGTGCTALAFVHEVLRNDPEKKVICLERGAFLLPTYFQNLSVPFRGLIGGDAETYPWTLSEKTHQSQLGYCHGYYPFFGGRSLFWSGWCPQPQAQALRDFPPAMHRAAADPRFWSQAREVLNVISTAEMEDPAFGALQAQLTNRLAHPLSDIPSLATSEPAMLAGGHRHKKAKTGFSKFCAAESLLSLVDQRHSAAHANEAPLRIGLNCTVKKIVMDGEEAVGVETSRGFFGLRGNRSKLVLCAGAVPNTTMLMNSIPRIRETAGKRLTGHFLSHISARVPVHVDASPWSQNRSNSLEIAAQCLLGYHPVTKRQYQIQVTAVHCPSPEKDLEELARKCPDYSASAQVNQLRGSENHVLFLCAAIGEFSERNEQCWIRAEDGDLDQTTNIRLQYLCNDEDEELWSFMEEATFQVVEKLAGVEGPKEYWDKFSQTWSTQKPTKHHMRIKGVVHEASSTFMGPEAEGGSVDDMYRPYGAKNVYVTGAGLFPTAGAWNPTLPMCGFAQDLARQLQTT